MPWAALFPLPKTYLNGIHDDIEDYMHSTWRFFPPFFCTLLLITRRSTVLN
jgi:hypothetical protein